MTFSPRALAAAAVLLALCGALLSCDDGTGPAPDPTQLPPVVRVLLDSPPDTLDRGQELRLSATALTGQGEPIPGATWSWTSSDPDVVRIDADGRATALAVGGARLRATASASGASASDSARVVVVQVAAEVSVYPEAPRLFEDDTLRFAVVAKDRFASKLESPAIAWDPRTRPWSRSAPRDSPRPYPRAAPRSPPRWTG